MIDDIKSWMETLTEKLRAYFQDGLLFVGLQGSYHRGEAHGDSDIDAVVILSEVTIDALTAYRRILQELPESHLSCGFISGKRELMNWPKHELFQFARDTEAFYGELAPLLPDIGRQDIIDGVRNGASALYHSCCHTAVHSGQDLRALRGMYKSAFFILQSLHYLQSGAYIATKRELLPLLPETERQILLAGMDWAAEEQAAAADPDRCFSQLLQWSASILNRSFG